RKLLSSKKCSFSVHNIIQIIIFMSIILMSKRRTMKLFSDKVSLNPMVSRKK
ncbi:unnamed protein product, partial [Bubo scandiacus]